MYLDENKIIIKNDNKSNSLSIIKQYFVKIWLRYRTEHTIIILNMNGIYDILGKDSKIIRKKNINSEALNEVYLP